MRPKWQKCVLTMLLLIFLSAIATIQITAAESISSSSAANEVFRIDEVKLAGLEDSVGCNSEQSKVENESEFPEDLFTNEQRKNGAVILHLLGMLYMFLCLATVCDEFFVPTLDVIMEILDISDDVAGATIMAAGGSAPELFTATIGVFISHSNVGVGTIVGSSAFNVMFAVAACTLLMKGDHLMLTPWPLCRGLVFYVVGLLILFWSLSDGNVAWFECLIMLMLYVGYVVFMRFDTQAEAFFLKRLPFCKINNATTATVPVGHIGVTCSDAEAAIGLSQQQEIRPNDCRTPSTRRPHPMVNQKSILRSISGQARRIRPRSQSVPTVETIDISTVTNVRRAHTTACAPNRRVLFNPFDYIASVKASMAGKREVEPVENRPETQAKTKVTFYADTSDSDTESNCNIEIDALFLKKEPVSLPPVTEESQEAEEDSQSQLDLSWPETTRKRIAYVIMAPIMFPLWLTIPDVRNPKQRQFYLVSFFMSVLWLAGLTYLNVWWATTLGATLGISDEIMGLTIIAAGTTAPDMLNSIIVARRGLGDMAIASLVGSNIFDITFGLQVPWLLNFIVKAASGNPIGHIHLNSDGLACSVGFLFLGLAFLFALICGFRLKINRKFGLILMFAYGIYLVLVILQGAQIFRCPLSLVSAVAANN